MMMLDWKHRLILGDVISVLSKRNEKNISILDYSQWILPVIDVVHVYQFDLHDDLMEIESSIASID